MINIGRLMTATPIPIKNGVSFYQPKIREILDMGEQMYWSMLKVWSLTRKEMLENETPETLVLSDFDLWTTIIFHSREMQLKLMASVDCFLHTKIEFLPISNTIMIGEGDSSFLLNEALYKYIQEICVSLYSSTSDQKEEQYKETEHMSAREREIVQKMKASAERLNKIKNGGKDLENQLFKQVLSLTAIGHYTCEQVFDMTMIQTILLLKKYVEVQHYELYTALSPYMDSKKGQTVQHWLNT